MKTLYISILLLILATGSVKATNIRAIQNNGFWKSNSTWNLNRKPTHSDTIIIEPGVSITLKETIELNNIVLMVYGTLIINEGDLKLSSTSSIYIHSGGTIKGQSSGIIEIGGKKKFDYSNPPITGPAFADGSTGSEPNGFVSFAVLTTRFIDFSLSNQGSFTRLSWATADERNNSHFNIERSNDGNSWSVINTISATKTTAHINKYELVDPTILSGAAYYRIRQVDRDGKSTFTAVKKIMHNQASLLSNIYVSADRTIAIKFNGLTNKNVMVRIVKLSGQAIHEQRFAQAGQSIQLHVPDATQGIYLVQVISEMNKMETKKIIL